MRALSLLAVILICFGIPFGGMIVIGRKQKGVWKFFLAGLIAFFVSQICIRIPLVNLVLPHFAWFATMQENTWLYGLFLGLTAGLFEEAARWIGFRCAMRKGVTEAAAESRNQGIAFGLGHGGIEAMLLVGLNDIVLLILVLAGQGELLGVGPGMILVGGIERLSAMLFHIGASLLVWYGIRKKRSGIWLLLAILLHTVMDAGTVIVPSILKLELMSTAYVAVLEVYAAIFGVLTLGIGLMLFRSEKNG